MSEQQHNQQQQQPSIRQTLLSACNFLNRKKFIEKQRQFAVTKNQLLHFSFFPISVALSRFSGYWTTTTTTFCN